MFHYLNLARIWWNWQTRYFEVVSESRLFFRKESFVFTLTTWLTTAMNFYDALDGFADVFVMQMRLQVFNVGMQFSF